MGFALISGREVASHMRRLALTSARNVAGIALPTAVLLNRELGKRSPSAYRDLVVRSEALDPVADVGGLTEIRQRFATDGLAVGYADRMESNDRIYGIKEAIFGADALGAGSPAVEHGLFLGDFVIREDTVDTVSPLLITFGNFRTEVLRRRLHRPALAVGPYVHYAEPHYDVTRLEALKLELGRTLLVFLSHSTPDAAVIRDNEGQRFDWLDDMATSFDSVVVCVYWWDLLNPAVDELRTRGYRIVSAGMMHDRNFLKRMKTLLAVADVTVGEGLGTNIGYALAEGIPHVLRGVSTETVLDRVTRAGRSRRLGVREVDSNIRFELEQALVEAIGDAQTQAEGTDRFFGFTSLRTREELRAMVRISADLRERSRFARSFSHAASELVREYEHSDSLKSRLLDEAIRGK